LIWLDLGLDFGTGYLLSENTKAAWAIGRAAVFLLISHNTNPGSNNANLHNKLKTAWLLGISIFWALHRVDRIFDTNGLREVEQRVFRCSASANPMRLAIGSCVVCS
jgi:hypothetical protein